MAKNRQQFEPRYPPFKKVHPPAEILNHAVIQGGVMEFTSKPRISQVPGDKRGAITDFSPAARLRMLKHFHRIDYEQLPKPLFMTLTYPDDVEMPELDERNMHRAHMARRLERITRRHVPAAWRVEWTDRKSGEYEGELRPHWHWLIFSHEYIHFKKVNQAWKETIGHKGYCRTEITAVDKCSVIPLYMAKYITKEAVSLSLVNAAYHTKLGRQYGWLRKGEIPLQPKNVYTRLSEAQRDAMTSLADEMLPWYDERFGASFTLLGHAAEDFRRILEGETLDE